MFIIDTFTTLNDLFLVLHSNKTLNKEFLTFYSDSMEKLLVLNFFLSG